MPTTKQNREFIEAIQGDLLDEAISWIQDNLTPDDVFSDKQLKSWAEANGYVEE